MKKPRPTEIEEKSHCFTGLTAAVLAQSPQASHHPGAFSQAWHTQTEACGPVYHLESCKHSKNPWAAVLLPNANCEFLPESHITTVSHLDSFLILTKNTHVK